MLEVTTDETADMQVFGLARHLGADTADAANDHVDADTGTAGFLQFQDDVAIADGVVLQNHGRRTAQTGGSDDLIHLIQQDTLEPKRCDQHRLAGLGQLLDSEVLEDVGRFFADLRVCGDEGVVGIQLAGLFVVVSGADLGDVGVSVGMFFGDEGQFGVDFVILETVDDRASGFFQLLRPVDVVLLVKTGAQLDQCHDFLAVLGGFDKGLNDLGFPGHTVEGHLDGDDIRVVGGFFQHRDKGPDGLVRVAEKDVVLLHFLGEVVILRRKHGPCRRVEQLGVVISFHLAGQLIEEAQIERTLLLEDALVAEFQLCAEQTGDLGGGGGRDLQADSGQLAAAFEQVGHDLTIVDVVVHHALFDVDIGVARDTEDALLLNGVLAEDQGCEVHHQLFHKGKLGLTILFDDVHPLHLAGNGNDAKARLAHVLFLQEDAQINLFVAEERERVAVINDLRTQNREQLALEILLPEMFLFSGEVGEIDLFIAMLRQIFEGLGVIFIALFLQLGRLGHDGVQLLLGGHVGLVLALFLFAAHQVRALLQGADTHHEKFVQIGTVDCKELDLFAQRNVFIFSQHEYTPVEVQPAQFAVDENAILFHTESPFHLVMQGGHPFSYTKTAAVPTCRNQMQYQQVRAGFFHCTIFSPKRKPPAS